MLPKLLEKQKVDQSYSILRAYDDCTVWIHPGSKPNIHFPTKHSFPNHPSLLLAKINKIFHSWNHHAPYLRGQVVVPTVSNQHGGVSHIASNSSFTATTTLVASLLTTNSKLLSTFWRIDPSVKAWWTISNDHVDQVWFWHFMILTSYWLYLTITNDHW